MNDLVRRIEHPRDRVDEAISAGERPPRREWLVTNGLGGYASGTVAGVMTRRYHGLLVASLPAPLGRMVMFNHLLERVRLPGRGVIWLGDEDEVAGPNAADRQEHLSEFRLELGLPVWIYRIDGFTIEKRVLMPYGQNTVHVSYTVLEGTGTARFNLRPSIQYRGYEAQVDQSLVQAYTISATGRHYELSASLDLPILRMMLDGEHAALTLDEKGIASVPYKMEEDRGYQWVGSLWSPGYFRADAAAGQSISLIASAEPWETLLALAPAPAADAERERRRQLIAISSVAPEDEFAAELVLAADQFIIRPAGRVEDAARAQAAGDEVRTVIAGYHWFTDWGRDTMISLEGLTLSTGRVREAGYILRTFAHYVRDGLIPNMFPDGQTRRPLPHRRRDALVLPRDRSLPIATGDDDTLRELLPVLLDIIDHHLRGTRFGIRVDPADGLLRTGRRGLPAHLDGRQGRRLGGDAAPRQGRRDQRALVQRPLPARRRGRDEHGGGDAADLAGARRARARSRSTRASGTTRAAISTTSSTASTATIRRAAPTRSSPSRCRIRCSTANAGSRS